MGLEAAIDNDVLIKAACYCLLSEVADALGGAGSVGVLGAAKFVIRDRLRRRGDIRDPEAAKASFAAFLDVTTELEPTKAEVSLATAIEEAATLESVALDSGESQLCAIVLHRAIRLLITGDKRAIAGAEQIKTRVAELSGLENRVACLEQLVLGIVNRLGPSESRSRICSEPDIDKALSICFSCSGAQELEGFARVGLQSYIGHLREAAPTVLYATDALFS